MGFLNNDLHNSRATPTKAAAATYKSFDRSESQLHQKTHYEDSLVKGATSHPKKHIKMSHSPGYVSQVLNCGHTKLVEARYFLLMLSEGGLWHLLLKS
jgi:hypothetical protein